MNSQNIYNTLASKAVNDHYLKRYIKFISLCTEANKSLADTVYTEKHHIIPRAKAFWPEYASLSKHKWNSATLTARQHIIAHWMLAKALGGGMWIALWSMVNGKGAHYRPDMKFNTRLVASSREAHAAVQSDKMKEFHRMNPHFAVEHSERCKGEGNPFYGKSHSAETIKLLSDMNTGRTVSDEVRAKISAAQMGREFSDETRAKISERQTGESNSFYGKTHSDETKAKISIASRRPSKKKGIPLSDEVKARMSAANKGRVPTVVTCPHCNKTGAESPMARWHFDNCKQKGL